MLIILLWSYIFFLIFIFLIFILLKINAYKFLNLSKNIKKNTNYFLILLIITSIFWFISIIYINWFNKTIIDETKITESVYY